MSLVLSFLDPEATRIALCGGKGANLARLSQAGFPVPEGLVVTAAAYRLFTASWDELWDRVEGLDWDRPERLREQCEELRARLREIPLPSELLEDLHAAVPPLLAKAPVSVRSSSTLEDLAGAAFAGQHDTYLGVATLEAVADSVRRCFASLWEDRAARYRHERRYGHETASMAVVIQTLVASETAGVAFCLNPITGDLGQIVLNSAYGLGETVVSGEGDIDQFVVEKSSGAVVESRIGEKVHAIVSHGTGTSVAEVPSEHRLAPSLGSAEIEALRALCLEVERHYGFPQDVEWALSEGKLHLLQARPVTRFPARWTRDESAERFPNIVTPLSWDFASEGFHESLAHSLDLIGMPPFEGRWFEAFEGYVYGNSTAVKLFTSGLQVSFESLEELRALVPVYRERYQWVLQLPVLWARDLDRYLLALGALGARDLSALSDDEVWRHLLAVDALGRSYFRPNIAISITHGVLHRLLFRLIRLVVPEGQAAALYDGLTCFCETKTNLVNRDLHALYLLARNEPELASLLREADRRSSWEEGRLARHPRFQAAFARFLSDHGHREVDWDAYHATWSGQPWVVLESVRLMLEREEVEDPAGRERELRRREVESERSFLAVVPEDLRFFATELLRLARAYTALDDLEHYQTTRLNGPFRSAVLALGSRLARRGVLPSSDHIFFLRKATLSALMGGGLDPGDAAREAAESRERYERLRNRAPPWVLGDESDDSVRGEALRGLPGSPGVAEGSVRRVLGVEDFSRFPAGAVLVARTTNPAWTPLFYSAAAVVTESGGPLSHGAVTAREIGIPAVMAVRGILSSIPDGTKVRVDGTRGEVTVIEAEAQAERGRR